MSRAIVRFLFITPILAIIPIAASYCESTPSPDATAQQFIVKYKANEAPSRALSKMTATHNFRRLALDERTDLLEVELSQAESSSVFIGNIRQQHNVEYVVKNERRQIHSVPSDALYGGQWYLQNIEPAGVDAESAWSSATGGSGTVVAVLDSGVRFDHPDLKRAAESGKLLPGFDFVSGESTSSFLAANDGDGWDADPSDPGDWIDSNDRAKSAFSGCAIKNSSWHGTRVAGLIGAASNNGIGIAGTSWGAYILPIRVLGKCGGYDSDILPAMRWAAGIHISGVPDNPYPAKILNLSFGSAGTCNAAYQSVIQELTAMGVVVIVSAGNEGGPVDAPANCPGAIGVSGLRHAGTKVGYSSLGSEVAIAAPAGNCVNTSGPCLYSLNTTYDIGTTVPAGFGYTDQFSTNLGTSFSAPLVAGVAALMHSRNANLSAAQMISRLQEGARPFPQSNSVPTCHVPSSNADLQQSECNCTTSTCGAGMLYAPGAVLAAERPIASVTSQGTVAAGTTLTLNGAASIAACNRSIASYEWSVISTNNTPAPVLNPSNQSTVQTLVPTSGSYIIRLTVTDNTGAQDHTDITVNSSSTTARTSVASVASCPTDIVVTPTASPPVVTTSAAPADDSGGGGGGRFGGFVVLLSALLLVKQRRLYFVESITRRK